MTIEQHYWREHWPMMTEAERLRFVFVVFDKADPGDILYVTPRPFMGWCGWLMMRWDCVD